MYWIDRDNEMNFSRGDDRAFGKGWYIIQYRNDARYRSESFATETQAIDAFDKNQINWSK